MVIGGGAAGFFCAANLDENKFEVKILEQNADVLQKVKISGGGRCNVTHACFDPKELVQFYPRGNRELISVFSKFQPGDTMEWFESRKVPLKIEDDNRIFPISDSSMSIIECMLEQVEKNKVKIRLGEGINKIEKKENHFLIHTKSDVHSFEKVIFTPGSSGKSMDMLRNLGHGIVKPVPSLFTFNIKDSRLKDLMGISFENAEISIPELKMESEGPLLITHWGLSGPGILRLSAWGALELNRLNYKFQIKINFVEKDYEECIQFLDEIKAEHAKKQVFNLNPFDFPKRFWHRILEVSSISQDMTFSHLTKQNIHIISKELCQGIYNVNGKSTFKEEFVTAGGVDLKEINFKTMESKIIPNLFLAGEILNIDAVTGGFNFQACWSEGFLISEHLKKLNS